MEETVVEINAGGKMKKLLYSVILIAFLVAMGIVYYSWDDDYHMSNRGWKVEKPELVTWEKLDTFVSEEWGFKVEYPSSFLADTTEAEVDFRCQIDDKLVFMRCFSMENVRAWDAPTAADSIAEIRKAVINDSVVMKDLHPDYFYLKGYNDERDFGFYGQYVVYKDVIYTYELYFPKDMEDRMQNLMGLIHNWNPE